jgi:hypothetical protein
MTTTITLPDELFRRAKKRGLEAGTTLTTIISDALREALSNPPRRNPRKRFKLITYGKGGVYPGVDLDRTSALFDRMDGSNDSSPSRTPKLSPRGPMTRGGKRVGRTLQPE